MILSILKQAITTQLSTGAQQILKRELKNYEIANFYNLHEEQLEMIMRKADHNLKIFVNEYLESLKNENTNI